MLLLLYKNRHLHELQNKAKILIHERNLFKQHIILIIVSQKTLKSLFISKL